jgi:hypothetical protein
MPSTSRIRILLGVTLACQLVYLPALDGGLLLFFDLVACAAACAVIARPHDRVSAYIGATAMLVPAGFVALFLTLFLPMGASIDARALWLLPIGLAAYGWLVTLVEIEQLSPFAWARARVWELAIAASGVLAMLSVASTRLVGMRTTPTAAFLWCSLALAMTAPLPLLDRGSRLHRAAASAGWIAAVASRVAYGYVVGAEIDPWIDPMLAVMGTALLGAWQRRALARIPAAVAIA